MRHALVWTALTGAWLVWPGGASAFDWQAIPAETAAFYHADGVHGIPLAVDVLPSRHSGPIPVTFGLPLHQGRVKDVAHARIVDAKRREVPSQLTVLRRWPDRSIKWLLVDIILPDGQPHGRFLEIGPKVTRRAFPERLRVRTRDKTLVVDTGTIRVVIPRTGGVVYTELGLDRNGDGRVAHDEVVCRGSAHSFCDLRDTETAGGVRTGAYTSRAGAGKVSVEARGPCRVTIRYEGWHHAPDGRRTMPYVMRLHLYRDAALMKLEHTLVVSEDGSRVLYPAIGLHLPIGPRAKRRYTFGADKPIAAPVGRTGAYLLQDADRSPVWPTFRDFRALCRVVADGQEVHRAQKAAGWVSVTGPRGRVSVLVRRFWEEYPKELELTGRGSAVNVLFWPRHKPNPLDLRRIDQRLPADYGEFVAHDPAGPYWYDYNMRVYHQRNPDIPHMALTRAGWGMAKTHEIILRVEPPDGAQYRADFAALRERPLLYVTPAYYCSTGAFGDVHPEDYVNFPYVETMLERSWDSLIRCQREWDHWVGMLTYGDVQTAMNPKTSAWNHYHTRFSWRAGEIEIPHTPFLMYLRSGKRKYFRIGEELSNHLRDVGSFDPVVNDGRLLGRGVVVLATGVRHDMSHYGSGKGCLPGYTGGDPDHMFAAGLVNHYFLTGDPRDKRMAALYAETVMKKSASYGRGMDYHGHLRGEDQCLRNLANAYDVTGDEKYKKAMEYFIRHESEGLRSMTVNRLGDVVRRCTGGAGVSRFYFGQYKQQALNYVYHLTRDPELLSAMKHGYRTFFYEALLGSGFASLYEGTRDPLDAKLCALSLRYHMGHGQREIARPDPKPARSHCANPTVMGTIQSNVPYLMAAVYKSRYRTHPRHMVGRHHDSYHLAEPAPDNAPARTDRLYVPVSLDAVANRDGQMVTYTPPDWGDDWPVKQPDLRPGDIAFDFGTPAMHTPGTLPVTTEHQYPSTRYLADRRTSFAGLPFGAEFEVGGVPFRLVDPDANPGRTVLVLGRMQTVRLAVSGRFRVAHFLGQVCGRRVLDTTCGAEYLIRYKDGSTQRVPLHNTTHYQYWHYPWYLADGATFAGKYGPYLINRLAVPLEHRDLSAIEVRDTGAGHGLMLLAVTLEKGGRTDRRWDEAIVPAEAIKAGRLTCEPKPQVVEGRIEGPAESTLTVPAGPGRYRVGLVLDSDPVGAAVDVWVGDKLVFNQLVPLGPTTLRRELDLAEGGLRLKLRAYDVTHKRYSGKGRWKLARVSLARLGPARPSSDRARKALVYGWTSGVLRQVVHQTSSATTRVEQEAHFPLTDDGVNARNVRRADAAEFCADVPNGTYDVRLYMAATLRVDLVVEGRRYERVSFPEPKTGRGYVLRKVFKPFTCRSVVRDGQFNLAISMQPTERVRGTWEIMGLVLRPVRQQGR